MKDLIVCMHCIEFKVESNYSMIPSSEKTLVVPKVFQAVQSRPVSTRYLTLLGIIKHTSKLNVTPVEVLHANSSYGLMKSNCNIELTSCRSLYYVRATLIYVIAFLPPGIPTRQ